MDSAEKVIDRLERAFGVGAERDIAWALIIFLSTNKDTSHINLQLVRQLTANGKSGGLDREILRTLQFLAGDGIGLLETKFEIFDEEEHPHGIENDVVRDAIALRLNPLTGEADPDIAKKIFMFFSPTSQVAISRPSSRD
jgi:hypothetical protein